MDEISSFCLLSRQNMISIDVLFLSAPSWNIQIGDNIFKNMANYNIIYSFQRISFDRQNIKLHEMEQILNYFSAMFMAKLISVK